MPVKRITSDAGVDLLARQDNEKIVPLEAANTKSRLIHRDAARRAKREAVELISTVPLNAEHDPLDGSANCPPLRQSLQPWSAH